MTTKTCANDCRIFVQRRTNNTVTDHDTNAAVSTRQHFYSSVLLSKSRAPYYHKTKRGGSGAISYHITYFDLVVSWCLAAVEEVANKGTIKISNAECFDLMLSKSHSYQVPNTDTTVDVPDKQCVPGLGLTRASRRVLISEP